jgi:hypothetical protein
MREIACDESHVGAPGCGDLGQGDALLARRPVAEEPHGIQGLAGAAGSDDDPKSGKVSYPLRFPRAPGASAAVAARCAAAATASASAAMSAGSGSRPGPVSAPVSRPEAGLDDMSATRSERRDVGLGGRVIPHLGVHRRGEHHRAARRQQGGGQQVVGQAARGFGQAGRPSPERPRRGRPPGRCGRGHAVDRGPYVRMNRLPGERGPGGSADELAARPPWARR